LGDGEDFKTIDKMYYETVGDLYNIQTCASIHTNHNAFIAVIPDILD
jgi:hypothetical protein